MLVSTVAATAVAFGIPLLAVPAPNVGPLPDHCVTVTPCVYIDPPLDPWAPPAGAVVTYHGRGWQPREELDASWGSYCPPTDDCLGAGMGTTVRADARGRFVFRLRHGTRPPAGRSRAEGRGKRGGELRVTDAPRERRGGPDP